MAAGGNYGATELHGILAAEEQRLQGELLNVSDSFLHDVHGIADSAAEKLSLLNQVQDLREQLRVKNLAEEELIGRIRTEAQQAALAEQQRADQLEAGEQREHQLRMEIANERQRGDVKQRDLKTQISNLTQHSETLTRHLREFETKSEQWSAEKRELIQQVDQLQEDLGRSLRYQQTLQTRMLAEQEAERNKHQESHASLVRIRQSEQEVVRDKHLALMAENEKLVVAKVEAIQREDRMAYLLQEAQVVRRRELGARVIGFCSRMFVSVWMSE